MHAGTAAAYATGDVGRVVGATARDDDDLGDARPVRLLLEEGLKQVLDVGRLVVGRHQDGDIHDSSPRFVRARADTAPIEPVAYHMSL